MKTTKLLSFGIIAVMLTLLTACDQSRKEVENAAAQVNSECPLSGPFGQITSVTVDGDYIVYKVEYNDDAISSFDAYRNHRQTIKKAFECYFRGTNSDMKIMRKKLTDAGMGVRFDITKENESGKPVSVTLEPSEVEYCNNNPLTSKEYGRKFIEIQVEILKFQLPIDVGNGIIMDNVFLNNDAVVYCASFTGGEGLIEAMESNIDAMKEEMLNSALDDQEIRKLLMECDAADVDKLIYRYTDNATGKSLDVTLPINEIRSTMAHSNRYDDSLW